MERTVQVLAAHFVLKLSSYGGQLGTMLAPALLTDREQQQQHVLTPESAKDAPVQRHAHCSVCGAARHTHRRTHTHTHTHTHIHTHIHTHTLHA